MAHNTAVASATRSTEVSSASKPTATAGGTPKTSHDNEARRESQLKAYCLTFKKMEKKLSPFRLWPTELVQGVADCLENTDLCAFRTTCAKIASQVDFPFKKRFGSIEYTISNNRRTNAAKFDRMRNFRRSRLADEVTSLTFIERESGGFPILRETLPAYEDGDIRFYRDEVRVAMTFVNSLGWFSNLRTLILSSDYPPRWSGIDRILPSTDSYSSVFKSLTQILIKRKTPLRIQVRHRDVISCAFNWTGERETTDEILIESLKTETAIEEDVATMIMNNIGGYQCFYNYEINLYCRQLQNTLLGHRLRVIKLSGFTFHLTDLSILFSSPQIISAPETLVLEKCTLTFEMKHSNGQTAVKWSKMKAFIEDLARGGIRHLEILDVEINICAEFVWHVFFQIIRKRCRLQSFRFERVDGIFFDWDGDNRWDDGRRLPEMIQKLGSVNSALLEMEKCIGYSACKTAYKPFRWDDLVEKEEQEEESEEMEEQEVNKQEDGNIDAEEDGNMEAEKDEEEDEDRYDLPDEVFGF